MKALDSLGRAIEGRRTAAGALHFYGFCFVGSQASWILPGWRPSLLVSRKYKRSTHCSATTVWGDGGMKE